MQIQKEKPELRTGRTTIADSRRKGSFSKRASEGTITVIRRDYPFCRHHKAFSKPRGIICCRCKRKIMS